MQATDSSLITFLKGTCDTIAQAHQPVSSKYHSVYDFVLREGQRYELPKPGEDDTIPSKVFSIINKYEKGEHFPLQQCYRNAFLIGQMLENLSVKYVEGFALNLIPTSHAWNAYGSLVIDKTWDKLATKEYESSGLLTSTREYIGVEIPIEEVARHMVKHGVYAPLLDCWECYYPLLK